MPQSPSSIIWYQSQSSDVLGWEVIGLFELSLKLFFSFDGGPSLSTLVIAIHAKYDQYSDAPVPVTLLCHDITD